MSTGMSKQKSKHIYQVVTYGRPSSGKTCLLAALAMPRGVHPEGYDAIWVRDETTIPKPAGDRNSWNQSDPAVARFLGRERLPMAIREIEAGKLPPATAVDIPFRFLFDFTTPDGCIRRVEMVDYSGELVNPDITEGDFAKQLIKHMETADAILVLAEATATEEQAERVRRDLHKLREALVLVSEKRRRAHSDPFPVGLVYDKWDRNSRMEKFSPAEAKIELAEFLNRKPPPPHVTLRNVLQAVAGDQAYFREFAASAFGKAKKVMIDTDNGTHEVEVPQSVSPLPSYGLEDPFVEVCRAADELELTRLNREIGRLKSWKLWQLSGRLAERLAAEAQRYAQRFPGHLTPHKIGNELSNTAKNCFFQQLGVAACAAFVLCMVGIQGLFVIYDEAMFATVGPAVNKPFNANDYEATVATLPQWKRAEEYLGAYQTRTWYRWASHWRHSPKTAAQQRLQLQERIASANGAIGIHGQVGAGLAGIEKRAGQIKSAADWKQLLTELEEYQIPEGHPELLVQKARIGELLKKGIDDSTSVEALAELKNDLNKFLENSNLTEAADLIARNASKFPTDIEALRTSFRQVVPDLIRNKVTSLCQPLDKSANNWSGATNYIERLENNGAFLDLMGSSFRGKLSRARDWIAKHQELIRYYDWYYDRDNGTKANLARDAGYRDAVDRYFAWGLAMKEKRDWVINIDRLYFHADGAASTTNAKIEVYVEGQYCDTVSPFIGNGDTSSADGSGTVKISSQTVDSQFTIRAKVIPTNWATFGEDAAVEGTLTTSIRDLAAAQRNFYCGMSGFSIQAYVYLSVDASTLPVLGNIPAPTEPSELSLR